VPAAGGQARSLTPGMASSASYLIWAPSARQLYFTEHYDGGSAISKLDPATGQVERLWQGDESINPPFEDSGISISDDGKASAVIRSSWRQPPEIWAGRIGEWSQRTHANAGIKPLWGEAKNLHWANDGFQVQGWLLYPVNFDAGRRYPLVVAVHGGPASSLKPSWPRPGFNPTLLSQQGYFVLMANPRGSYGQGEKFTMANVKDFGGGDLRDILAGVDEAVKTAPIDPQRIGLTGWSYGGFMTMWAVTQTTRFRAAVAGAGIANWKSYYGENAIDQWMIPYFGATVYDDPAVYGRSSAIDFIKQVKTPTLVVVGAGDGECPPPQSFEFWHALKTLGVKTELVVYPDEGHRFSKPADQRDVLVRMIQWFNENLR
jgi:dipeptidyl aminopeptidase/acylaminoacyl peptidase